MHFSAFAVPLSMATSLHAAAVPSPVSNAACPAIPFTAKFDDLPALPAGSAFQALPTPYNGLDYVGMGVTATVQAQGVPGVVPQSPPNAVVINVASQILASPRITTFFPNSPPATFRLSTFYYGAVLSLMNGVLAFPLDVDIFLVGYNTSDQTEDAEPVCTQRFEYRPAGLAQQSLAKGTFNCDFDLTFVEVRYSSRFFVVNPLAAVVLDNLGLAVRQKQC